MSFDIVLFRSRTIPCQEEIMSSWAVDWKLPLVSVVCTVYNQEAVIEDSIRGILLQQTTIPFEIILHDDASTDRTPGIVMFYAEKYPKIIKPYMQVENQYSKGNSILEIASKRASGKYLAICEGDDFWIDPLKLENQIKVLESDGGYGLVYSPAYVLRGDSLCGEIVGEDFSGNEIFYKNPIPTLTTMFDSKLYSSYLLDVKSMRGGWKMADYPIWLWLSIHSKLFFLPKPNAVYRVTSGTASRPEKPSEKYDFNFNSFEIANFFAKKVLFDKDYCNFLEKRYVYLYLYCIKNGLAQQELFVEQLSKLNISLPSCILMFILNNLKLKWVVGRFIGYSEVIKVLRKLYK